MQVTEVVIYNNPNIAYIPANPALEPNTRVVVSLNGTQEYGIVKHTANVNKVELWDFVRLANEKDNIAHCETCKLARKMLPEIKQEAEKLGLNMKISFIALNLDKTKITVNYTADERIDFRELLKVLSAKYKSRIEMKQIGNRDETKTLGAVGTCGRVTCCKLFLNDFEKVSIKMAKNQNIALNPNRINGMCGRLLCCFKYEDEFYEQMQKKMPKVGFKVTTPDGVGIVSSNDFLKETVTVTFTKEDTQEIKTYPLADITFNNKSKT